MSHIHFTSICGRNYNSYTDFVFPIVAGRHLVIGPNGAGKSSIFESMPWTMWKKSIRDKDPSRDGLGDTMTGMEFLSNNASYEIKRYWRDPKEYNGVKLLVGGEDISLRKNSGVDEEIAKVINISPDLFISTIVVLQGLPINFSALTPGIRKAIVEEMLGFSVWDGIRNEFYFHNREVAMKKAAIDGDLEKNKKEMISLNAKIETVKNINTLQKDELLKEITDIKVKYKEVCLTLSESTKKMVELYDLKTSSQFVTEVNSYNHSLTILNNRAETLKAIVESKICPECDQNYPMQKIKTAQDELATIEPKSIKIKESVAGLKKTLNQYLADEQALTKLELTKSSYEYQMKTVSDKINNATVPNNLDEMEANLANLVVLVNTLTEEITTYETSVNNLKYVDNLLIPSSKFRTKVLEKYLDYINTIIESVTPMLFNNISVKIEIDAKSAGIELKLVRRGLNISYKSLSGGEKKRLDVIIILAFQRFLMESSGISSNLIVFDEIFDALDKKGVEDVLTCIDSLFPESMSQYIITHNDSLKSMFSSVIKIVKDETGVSRIEYSNGE